MMIKTILIILLLKNTKRFRDFTVILLCATDFVNASFSIFERVMCLAPDFFG